MINYNSAVMNPASINIEQNSSSTSVPSTNTQRRRLHRHRTPHSTQPTQPPAPSSVQSSQSTDLTTFTHQSTWKEWLIGMTAALIIPMWYGFKTGAGQHIATWLFTRYNIVNTQQLSNIHNKPVIQHSVQYQFYNDNVPVSKSSSITSPAVLNQSQATQYAAAHHIQYPAVKPLIIPLHSA